MVCPSVLLQNRVRVNLDPSPAHPRASRATSEDSSEPSKYTSRDGGGSQDPAKTCRPREQAEKMDPVNPHWGERRIHSGSLPQTQNFEKSLNMNLIKMNKWVFSCTNELKYSLIRCSPLLSHCPSNADQGVVVTMYSLLSQRNRDDQDDWWGHRSHDTTSSCEVGTSCHTWQRVDTRPQRKTRAPSAGLVYRNILKVWLGGKVIGCQKAEWVMGCLTFWSCACCCQFSCTDPVMCVCVCVLCAFL